MQQVTRENERLRQELRRSGEERMMATQTTSLGGLHSDPTADIQKKQIQLLEQEKEDLEHLYQDSQEIINRLEAEVNDLKHPLQPHLMKLDMEARQVGEIFVLRSSSLHSSLGSSRIRSC